MEGKDAVVRSMLLGGVKKEDAIRLLEEKELQGADDEWEKLIERYSGNTLALKLVAETIKSIFGSSYQ